MSVKVNSTLIPRTVGYALIEDKDVKGSFHTVSTIAARDAMPDYVRKAGMFAYVIDSTGSGGPSVLYQLNNNLLSWTAFTSGASLSNASPPSLGIVSAGIATAASRADHVHPFNVIHWDATTPWATIQARVDSLPAGSYPVIYMENGYGNIPGSYTVPAGTAFDASKVVFFNPNGVGLLLTEAGVDLSDGNGSLTLSLNGVSLQPTDALVPFAGTNVTLYLRNGAAIGEPLTPGVIFPGVPDYGGYIQIVNGGGLAGYLGQPILTTEPGAHLYVVTSGGGNSTFVSESSLGGGALVILFCDADERNGINIGVGNTMAPGFGNGVRPLTLSETTDFSPGDLPWIGIDPATNKVQAVVNGAWQNIAADPINSIAALRAIPAPINGTVQQITGYYTAGDGGGGLFVYDATSTATDDGGSVIKPTAVSGAGRWLRDLSDGVFNVRAFGARPTDSGENFDSLFAFNAAMLAMGPAYAFTDASYTGQKLFIPPSPGGYLDTFYYLSDEFRVTRNCEIWGIAPTGGSVGGATKLKFPLGKRGVVFMSYVDGTGERADGASIHNCQVFSTFPGDVPTTAVWRASHAYIVGDIITPRYSHNKYGYAYKCTVAGTSGSTEPAFPDLALGGGVPPDPYDNATYTDGGVTWITIQLHGIDVRSNFVQIENCYVHHWPGNGINCHGATGASMYNTATADIAQIRGGTVRYCGGSGVSMAGHDGNAGFVHGVSSTQNIGWGFRDDSVLGQMFYSCHADNNARGSYSVGRACDCYSEGGVHTFGQGMTWIGGIPGRFSNEFQLPWSAGESISIGDTRVPTTPNGYQFVALTNGTTDSIEPTWFTDPITVMVDNTVQWYCIGEYEVNHGSAFIDYLSDAASPRTFKDKSSANPSEFFACYPQNAGALWGWKQTTGDLFTMQPGPAAHVLTANNASYGDPAQAHHPFAVTTSELVFPDDVGAGRFDIVWPFFIGSPYGTARIKMYVDTVPPSDGGSSWVGEYWARGSIVWNKTADATTLGWTCTASGTPGTWVALTLGGSSPIDPTDLIEYSLVDLANSLGALTTAGNDSVGQKILFKHPVTVTGVRFYWPGGLGALTIKVSLWDPSNTRVGTTTVAVNAAGIYTGSFTGVVVASTDLYKNYVVSIWENSSTNYAYLTPAPGRPANATSNVPYTQSPWVQVIDDSMYATGDAIPVTSGAGTAFYFAVEPIFTVT